MSLLGGISGPKGLPSARLAALAQEIRAFLIAKVSGAGGHLGPNLFALPSRFLPHASRDQILHAHGLDGAGIATAILKRLASTHRGKVTAKEM